MSWDAEFFTADELRCQCGCGEAAMHPAFMQQLYKLRRDFDQPLTVSSGYRCPTHNDNVSSTGRYGPHTTGKAVDLRISGTDAVHLLQLATAQGFAGIGIAQRGNHAARFIHVDTLENAPRQPRPWIWSY